MINAVTILNTLVLIGVLVTAVNEKETKGHPIFVQLPSGDPDYKAEHSGLYIYMKKTVLLYNFSKSRIRTPPRSPVAPVSR